MLTAPWPDWVYVVAAGINTVENAPGYEKILIAPHPDTRLDWLKAVLETRTWKSYFRMEKRRELLAV